MDRKSSYFKSRFGAIPKDEKDALLKHEQGHFDLAEIYSRKLRKELAKIVCKTQAQVQKDVDDSIDKFVEQVRMEHKKYDTGTENGAKKPEQDKWNTMINNQLKVE